MSNLINESQNKKRGLGRGLGSLLSAPPESLNTQETSQLKQVSTQSNVSPVTQVASPTQSTQESANTGLENKVWQIDIEKLSSGKYQPRKNFEKQSIQELADSIKENGILQPIVARKLNNGAMEIIAGERRWRAAQLAGKHQVPVIIKEVKDKEALELAIIENIQREDLSPIEEAEGYERLINEFKLTQQDVAARVGKDRATIANAVRLMLLPYEVKAMINDKTLSAGHAKVLLSLKDPKNIVKVAKQVVAEKLSVRKLEKLVDKINTADEEIISENQKTLNLDLTNKLITELADEMQKILGTKVTIDYANSKGKVNIYFYSDDELTNLVEKLRD